MNEKLGCMHPRIETKLFARRAGGKMVSRERRPLPEMVSGIRQLREVAEFNDSTPETDPHGEHDFLSFEHLTNRTFF